jgi:hypothetical protein
MDRKFKIKKISFLIMFFTLLCLSVFGQERPRITIVNNTGYTVYYVYISQTATDDWEEDVMDDDVLINGDSVNVRLQYSLNVTNRYDIQLVDEDGDSYTKWDVLVTPNARIVFTIADLDD